MACTICNHPQIRAITADLMARVPYRTIEQRYSVSRSAIDRHVTSHITRAFRQLAAAAKLGDAAIVAEPVLAQMRGLHVRALAILAKAEAAKDHGTALVAIRECRRNLELVAKLTGELDPHLAGETGQPLTVIVQYVDKQVVATSAPPPLPDAIAAPARLNGGSPEAT